MNPLVTSALTARDWLGRLEKLSANLRASKHELWLRFEPARRTFADQIYWLDHVGECHILEQTATDVLQIAGAKLPEHHAAWMRIAARVQKEAPEHVAEVFARS